MNFLFMSSFFVEIKLRLLTTFNLLLAQGVADGCQVVEDPWIAPKTFRPRRVSQKKEAVVTTGVASSLGLETVSILPGVNLRDPSLKLTPWLLYVTLRVRKYK